MLETSRRLIQLFDRRDRIRASFLFVAMVGGALLEMAGVGAIPAFVATLTDPDLIRGHPLGAQVLGRFGVGTNAGVIVFAGAALALVFVVKAAYLTVLSWASNRFVFRSQVTLASRLLGHYLGRPYDFHLHRNSSQLLNNTNNDAMAVVSGMLFPLLQIGMEALTLAAIFLLLLTVEPITSLAALGILGGTSYLVARLMRRRMIELGREQRIRREQMIRSVNEGLGGIKMTKVLGREGHFLERFETASTSFASLGMTRAVLGELPRLLLEVVAVLGLLAVAAFFISRGGTPESLVPVLTLLAVAVVRMIPAFNRIVGALNSMRFGRAALDAVYGDLVEAQGVEPEADPLPALSDAIRLQGVGFAYEGVGKPVLEDIDLEIRRGEAVGLVGPTGSGKTTLVDLILGLLSPSQGRVLVDGVDLRGREGGWRRQVGYIPQEIFLADVTIRENVAFGLGAEEIDESAVWQALEDARLADFVRTLPLGLETPVGERGVRLSGGQRQRIGIARALYDAPQVLVLDEATSALDHETEQVVMGAIDRLKGSRTLILIAHRLSTVENCDRVVLLRDGRTVAEGPPGEVLPLTVRALELPVTVQGGSSSGG
ncbi:MAG: ABC transporter ATP-binding protein [Gemmatimonadota bacterium]